MSVMPLVLIGTLAAVGGQVSAPRFSSEPAAAQDHSIVPPGKDPYVDVFRALQEKRAMHELRKTQSKFAETRVVCGMVVVPMTPAADPKILVQPAKKTTTDYKILKIEPRLCHE